jgi:phosphatidate phosphatase APP1
MAYVHQLSIIQFKKKTIMSGTVLRGSKPNPKRDTSGYFGQVIRSYFRATFKNRQIVISAGEKAYPTLTNHQGGFWMEVDHPLENEVTVFDPDRNKQIPVIQTYPLFFADSAFPLAVVSDIDDTLMVSHTLSSQNRIRKILFTSPANRIPVGFTSGLLKTINDRGGRIFYVSKSESNLFGLLTHIIKVQKIPEGSLFLTPYLRFGQLFRPKKGRDFKEQSIKQIIDRSENKMFILIGDDTQQDMFVYGRMALLYPDRIFKIYIHKTRKLLTGNKTNEFNKLKDSGVPFIYFSDQDEVAGEIEAIDKLTN